MTCWLIDRSVDWIDWLIDWLIVWLIDWLCDQSFRSQLEISIVYIERIRIMGARRCQVEHEKRIPYLPATMYYFVYNISILLTRRSRLNSSFKKRTRCPLLMTLFESRFYAVVRALAFHQCGRGSIPWPAVICELNLFVLWEVFPRVLRFSPFTKNQHLIWITVISVCFVVQSISKGTKLSFAYFN